MITTVLTSQIRNNLASAIIGTSGSLVGPAYIQWGTGSAPALGTDETVSGPYLNRAPLTVTLVSTTTSGDTANFTANLTASGTQGITNFGLFSVGTNAPVGTLTSPLNPLDASLTLSGYAGFPGTYPFDIQVCSEVMTVNSGNGSNVFYVTRHANGSPISVSGFGIGSQVVGGNGTTNGKMILKSSFPALVVNAGDALNFNISIQFI